MKPTHKQPSSARQKNSQSFLDKFKDKHSVISKEGLLKLFQSKRKSIETKIKEINQSKEQKSSKALKVNLKHLEETKVKEIIKVRSSRKNSSDSVARSVQLPELNKKLPAIHKSVSTTLKLNKKQLSQPGVAQIQTDSLPRIMKKAPIQTKNNKTTPRYSFQLDKFAVDHLDFLQKFDQRLRKRQVISH